MVCNKYWLIIVSIFISACNANSSSPKIDLNYLYYANPVEDVKKAISKKDYRFYGIYGASLRVPKISRECINVDKDIKIMAGNSEVTFSYEEQKFNALAQVYADNYNFHMMIYLKDKGLYNCSHPVRIFKEG
jgi:hypothetical protein